MSKALRSHIANNVINGTYISMPKFAHFGSVIEDSIFAQQKEADRKLAIIQLAKQNKLNKKK